MSKDDRARDDETPLTDPGAAMHEREDRIYGIVDDPSNDVPKLMGDLMDLDVNLDSVQVYRGRRGMEELSPTDEGFLTRIARTVQRIGYEGRILDRVETELKAGHALVAVEVDEEHHSKVIKAMKAHGAHDMHRYGRFTIVDL